MAGQPAKPPRTVDQFRFGLGPEQPHQLKRGFLGTAGAAGPPHSIRACAFIAGDGERAGEVARTERFKIFDDSDARLDRHLR